ncbi:TPA: hypothetical protein ACNVDX_003119 [Citrobacter gillenii]
MASITTKERTSSKGITSYQVQVRGKGVEKPYSKSFPSPEEAQVWADIQDAILHGASTTILTKIVTPTTSEITQPHQSKPFTIANLVDEYLRDTQYKGGVKKKGYSTVVQRMSPSLRI